MSDEGFRITTLNAVTLITIGLFLAGFPLVWVVVRESYGQTAPVTLGGDYRGWMMAHLEGLLNGLLVIGLAATTRLRPMTQTKERVLLWSLLIAAWGNTIASLMAPLLGVRGMAFNQSAPNNLVAAMFIVALAATVPALFVGIQHLAKRTPA
jgi:hypothetical protein